MSYGYRSGTEPIRTNSKWVLWFKYAQKIGSTLLGTEPKRRLKEKVAKKLSGT